jgi:hypothetical protein
MRSSPPVLDIKTRHVRLPDERRPRRAGLGPGDHSDLLLGLTAMIGLMAEGVTRPPI